MINYEKHNEIDKKYNEFSDAFKKLYFEHYRIHICPVHIINIDYKLSFCVKTNYY